MTADRTRSEQKAFLEGVAWIAGHFIETSRRVKDDQRGVIQVEGKPPVEAILRSGNPAFAKILYELADVFLQEGIKEAKIRYPDFDPLPRAQKAGESSGF